MKLFDESYFGLHGKSEYRLYFEEAPFGVFVWFTPEFELKSFQVMYSDKISVLFRRPDKLQFGGINNEPISGGISGSISEEEKALLRASTVNFEFENLPEMQHMIKSIMSGQQIEIFQLPAAEVDFLKSQKYKSFL